MNVGTAFVVIAFLSPSVMTFDLTLLHTNDVGDRMVQFDSSGGKCSEGEAANGECYGGVARRATVIKDVRETEDNVLLLDAGDQFTGTNWFYLYQGVASSYFMNRLGYDVMALGNHEFDNHPEGLAPFLKDVNFPVVSANTDASLEPVLDGLFNNSVILNVGGETVGVVGYTYANTPTISWTGNVIFNDEIESVQAEVDTLVSMGINKIIALGHSGITKDMEIAAKVRGVDIVIGAHTDTFLYTGDPPDAEVPYGPYPVVVTPDDDPEGTVLVVTDYAYAKYLGRLDVTFDDQGRLLDWSGNPILLDASIEEDPDILAEINERAEAVSNLTSKIIGSSHVFLDGTRESCRTEECNMGNMLADAYIWFTLSSPSEDGKWNQVDFAFHNSGGIRSTISQDVITFGDIANVLQFGNTIDTLELEGRYVKDMLEVSVAYYDPVDLEGKFLQFSGLYITYDLSREPYDRVVDVLVRCTECSVPRFEPLQDDQTYTMAGPSFIVGGGDGYDVLAEQGKNRYTGNLDTSVISDYLELFSPVYAGVERRITFVTPSRKPTREKFRKVFP